MEVAGEGALPSPTATMVVAAEEKCEGNSKTQRQRELRKKKKRDKQPFQHLGQGRRKGEDAGIALQP